MDNVQELRSKLRLLVAHVLIKQFAGSIHLRKDELKIAIYCLELQDLVKYEKLEVSELDALVPEIYTEARELALLMSGCADTAFPLIAPFNAEDLLQEKDKPAKTVIGIRADRDPFRAHPENGFLRSQALEVLEYLGLMICSYAALKTYFPNHENQKFWKQELDTLCMTLHNMSRGRAGKPNFTEEILLMEFSYHFQDPYGIEAMEMMAESRGLEMKISWSEVRSVLDNVIMSILTGEVF